MFCIIIIIIIHFKIKETPNILYGQHLSITLPSLNAYFYFLKHTFETCDSRPKYYHQENKVSYTLLGGQTLVFF
jgi:hypothetical protein